MSNHTCSHFNTSTSTNPKELGSAKEGVHHWMGQRISAIGLIPSGFLLLLWVLAHGNSTYAEVIASLSSPWISALIFFFVSVVCYHAYLGMQVIIEDYAHSAFWRYWLIIISKFFAVILPILTLFFLIKIMLKVN